LRNGWNSAVWRKELESSHSWKRLGVVTPRDVPGWEVRYANACPGIGVGASSTLVPCKRHLRRAINRAQPMILLACGRVAEAVAADVWSGPLVAIPHPAARSLTNDILERGRAALLAWSRSYLRCHQPRVPRIALRLEYGLPSGRLVPVNSTYVRYDTSGVMP
jgi:hypothetical protein